MIPTIATKTIGTVTFYRTYLTNHMGSSYILLHHTVGSISYHQLLATAKGVVTYPVHVHYVTSWRKAILRNWPSVPGLI